VADLGSDLASVALRTAIIYLAIVVMLRVAGKREVGQLSILDLVVLLLIADASQNAMVGTNTTLLGGVVAAGTLVVFDRGLRLLTDRSRRASRLVQGEPRLLVRDGVTLPRAMREEGIDRDELEAALRAHGLERPAQVKLAVLETDGSISVIPKPEGH
jgi:uncharacterized membrane protein YcaP (DUF421 family)